jgi:predicted metal-dependent hydrolase
MKTQLNLSGISIEVTRKNIKNIYLRVYPSEGRVVLNCPWHTNPGKVREFAEERLPWIKKHLQKRSVRNGKPKPRYITGEKHPVWGEMRELKVFPSKKPQTVFLNDAGDIVMQVKNSTISTRRKKLLQEWYRSQLKEQIPVLVKKWEPVMNVAVNEFGVKKMKTRWGTCNIRDRRIWLNLELAKIDPACLEFIVVHEMVHLLEKHHTKRFYQLMDKFLPDWKEREKLLNAGLVNKTA